MPYQNADLWSWLEWYLNKNKNKHPGPYIYTKNVGGDDVARQEFKTLEAFVNKFAPGATDIQEDIIRKLVESGMFQVGTGVKRTLVPKQK